VNFTFKTFWTKWYSYESCIHPKFCHGKFFYITISLHSILIFLCCNLLSVINLLPLYMCDCILFVLGLYFFYQILLHAIIPVISHQCFCESEFHSESFAIHCWLDSHVAWFTSHDICHCNVYSEFQSFHLFTMWFLFYCVICEAVCDYSLVVLSHFAAVWVYYFLL